MREAFARGVPAARRRERGQEQGDRGRACATHRLSSCSDLHRSFLGAHHHGESHVAGQRRCYGAPHEDNPCAFLHHDALSPCVRRGGHRFQRDRWIEHHDVELDGLDLDRRDRLRARRDDGVHLSRGERPRRGDVPCGRERLRRVQGARRRHLRLPGGAKRRVLHGRRHLLLLRHGLRSEPGFHAGSEGRRAHRLRLRRGRLRRRVQVGVRGRRHRRGLRALREEGWNGPVQDSVSGVRRSLSRPHRRPRNT